MFPPVDHTSARQLVSVGIAATYFGVSTKTIRRYIAQGRLDAFRVGERLLRVDLGQLDSVMRRIPAA